MPLPKDEKFKKELQEYRDYLDFLVSKKYSRIFTNRGIEHASILMSTMFDNTIDMVRMYCRGLGPALTSTEPYLPSFQKLLDSGIKLRLLVETTEYINDGAFAYVVQTKNKRADDSIQFRKIKDKDKKNLNEKLSLDYCNFSVFDNDKFRVEISPDEFKAFGSFNHPEIANILIGYFDEAFNNAIKN